MSNRIFAHRGYWYPDLQPNSIEAMSKAFAAGFSVETDLRDANGELVISHDPIAPRAKPLTFKTLLSLDRSPDSFLALNVKSDGLGTFLDEPDSRQFFFDMSVPEARRLSQAGHQLALRLSDVEPMLIPNDIQPNWIWLDAFNEDWLEPANLLFIERYKGAVVVSPELHGRDKSTIWEFVASCWRSTPNLCICTDFPSDFLNLVSN